jgi:hypothetical protein
MSIRKIMALCCAALFLTMSAPVGASTLIIDPVTNELLGASGVSVGGSLYDVSFLEGSCAELFSGCDGLDDFQFQDAASVNLATAALLDQVFIGIYDSGAFRTAGCEPNLDMACAALVPYGGLWTGSDYVDVGYALNLNTNFLVPDSNGVDIYTVEDSTLADSRLVYARFTLVGAPVPEPNTWAMMLLGFGCIGMAVRRGRKTNHHPLELA